VECKSPQRLKWLKGRYIYHKLVYHCLTL
jgi:hypothetical protein